MSTPTAVTRATRRLVASALGLVLCVAGLVAAFAIGHQSSDAARTAVLADITSSPLLELTVVDSSRDVGAFSAAAPARTSDGRSGFLAGAWVEGTRVDAYAVTRSGWGFSPSDPGTPGDQLTFLAADQAATSYIDDGRPEVTPEDLIAVLAAVGALACLALTILTTVHLAEARDRQSRAAASPSA